MSKYHFTAGKNSCSVEGCDKPYRSGGFCAQHYRKQGKCSTCGIAVDTRADRCQPCRLAAQKGVPRKNGGRRRTQYGYITVSCHHGHPNASAKGIIFEHVLVMTQMLGRTLLPGENVHHKNGVRDDNRPENLELWVTKQPVGQRPEDLVAWALEILERYGATDTAA